MLSRFYHHALPLVLGLSLTGCQLELPSTEKDESSDGSQSEINDSRYQPTVGIRWQWQLKGSVNTGYNVALYDIDLFDSSKELISTLQESGRKVICYFSAGSYEEWRPDAGQFKAEAIGHTLDGWPDERWLDVRHPSLEPIMEARLDLAREKGCDGVEPDNVDGYNNESGFALSGDDQLAYNQFLAQAAHERGLSIALKNDLDQVEQLVDYFDFAVNEECFAYEECDKLKPFIDAGKPVLNVEYDMVLATDAVAQQALCEQANQLKFSTLILPLDLDDSFRIDCQDI